MDKDELVQAVYQHAVKNYDKDGWAEPQTLRIKAMWETVTNRHQHESGRWYLEYVPTFTAKVIGNGKLTFARFQVWEDEPDTHAAQKDRAMANAKKSLLLLAQEAQ